jgi:pimeloyl-ACP methyl ester carboxylesterase
MRLAVTEMGEGPPLVLLHGLFGARQNFGAVQKALAGQGRRVLALDLRNHGASPHVTGMAYPDMAADVAETLQAERAWPADILGHSMGGKVAMALALARPEAVSRLVVADIAPVAYPAPLFAEYLQAMRGMALPAGLTRREADAALAQAVPQAPLRAFLLQNLVFPAEPPRWRVALEEIAAAMPEIAGWPALAGSYAGPTLVLAGTLSPYVRPEHRALFTRLFPAARFAALPTGHWLHAENPAAFLAEVSAFLAAQTGPH